MFVLIYSRNQQPVPVSDYIVMNGVFTEKQELRFDEMLAYFERIGQAAFAKAEQESRSM